MELSSDSFEDIGMIPSKFTCEGEDISPALEISDVPSEAESLAIVVDDPDAPGSVFDHWIIWNISPEVTSIPSGVSKSESVDSLGGAYQGKNDFGEIGYRGPCPPPGKPHNYVFTAYALDSKLDLNPGASKDTLEDEIEGKVVAEEELIGKYGR